VSNDMWTYRDTLVVDSGADVTGYEVEASDGSIGKIDEVTYETGSSYIVVDTGPWIFGKKVMLPAGVVREVDQESETVFVDRTKDQIKHAPEYDSTRATTSTEASSARTTRPATHGTAPLTRA